jgi:hypothetical protein
VYRFKVLMIVRIRRINVNLDLIIVFTTAHFTINPEVGGIPAMFVMITIFLQFLFFVSVNFSSDLNISFFIMLIMHFTEVQ